MNKDKSFRDRLDMFFYDTDLMPLFVQENYIKVRVTLPKEESYSKDRGDYHIMRRMAEAADTISESDVVGNKIRAKQEWGLLPRCPWTTCLCYGTRCVLFIMPNLSQQLTHHANHES